MTLLVVEDNLLILSQIERKLLQLWPTLRVSFVVDAENAAKAVLGEKYYAFNPRAKESLIQQEKIAAVIWDNQIPSKRGENPREDLGTETAKALYTSDKVDQWVKQRFIMHSADNGKKFESQKIFAEILPKPLDYNRLNILLLRWALISHEEGTSIDEKKMESVK